MWFEEHIFGTTYRFFEILFFHEIKYFIPIIYTPLLLWFALRAHHSIKTSDSDATSRNYFFVHSILNIIVGIVWILIFAENLMNHDSVLFSMVDVGAPLGMFILLFLIPIGLVVEWWVGKKGGGLAENNFAYLYTSRVFYIISIVPGIWLVLFYTGIIFSSR